MQIPPNINRIIIEKHEWTFGLEYFLFINIESNWIGMQIIVLKNRPNLPGLKSNNQQDDVFTL